MPLHKKKAETNMYEQHWQALLVLHRIPRTIVGMTLANRSGTKKIGTVVLLQ